MNPHASISQNPSGPEATRLAAKVAHELNNPLDAVLRFVSLAQRKARAGEYTDIERHLADAQFGLQRMAETLRELMDIGRQTHDLLARQDVATAANLFALDDLLSRATRTTAALAEQKYIQLQIDNSLPPTAAFRFDLRVAQILSNLLKNAVEASPEGSTITLTLASPPSPAATTLDPGLKLPDSGLKSRDPLVVTVVDAGPGLPPELIPRLFSPFVTTKAQGTGHGLGLAISRELAHSLKGSLVLANRLPPEKGCIATLTLPA